MNLAKVKNPEGWRFLTVGGSPNMGQALYAMFSPEPHKFHWFVKRGKTPEEVAGEGAMLRRRLRKAIRRCDRENIIISGEALSLVEDEGIAALRDFLMPLCDEVRIIGYVRPPMAFRMSIFQQQMKHGKNNFNVADIKLRYRRKFEKFDQVFGRENVILRKFDPAKFTHQCIVADFCEQIGIEPLPRGEISRANESLSREACGILYAYRKFGPGYGVGESVIRENIRVIAPLLAMRGAKFKVSEAIVKLGLDLEKKDIRWMEKRLGASLQENMKDDGTEVASEEDLLTVSRASCEQFAARFEEIHGIAIPTEKIPAGDPVDPRRVAEFVDYCRGLCRDKIETERTLRRKLRAGRKRLLGRCGDFIKTLMGRKPQAARKRKRR